MREKVAALESEKDALQQRLDETSPPPPTSIPSPPQDEPQRPEQTAEHLVHEERLKWQVEVVNVRRELEGKLEQERRGWAEEREGLKREVGRVEKELMQVKAASQQAGKLQADLKAAQQRWVET